MHPSHICCMKFQAYKLHQHLQNNLEVLGFKRPTDIQYKAIPAILKGEDVLAIAQTGTGKTAAFAIPILEQLLQKPRNTNLQALVMVPTRELAMQIHGVISSLCKGSDIKPTAVVGGVEQDAQIERLLKGSHIVVATPGRMFDLIHQKAMSLQHVRWLVLDEADRMLALGFNKDIVAVKKMLPARHQTLFFSATINDKIKRLAYAVIKNPLRIQVSPQNKVNPNVAHQVMMVSQDEKRFYLERIIRQNPTARMLVFVRTRVRAGRVQQAMKRVELATTVIHGELEQQERFKALQQFEQGEVNVLITTDVSARGIDLKNISFVINYDLPDEPENYVHRVGRTGRGMQKGYALSFCSAEESELLTEIEAFTGQQINTLELPKDDQREIIDTSNANTVDMRAIKALIADAEKKPKRKR